MILYALAIALAVQDPTRPWSYTIIYCNPITSHKLYLEGKGTLEGADTFKNTSEGLGLYIPDKIYNCSYHTCHGRHVLVHSL